MPRFAPWIVGLTLGALLCGFAPRAAAQQRIPLPGLRTGAPEPQGQSTSPNPQSPDLRSSGSISGTVVDQTGAAVAGARIKLSHQDQSPDQEVFSSEDGQFSFANVTPGPFQLTITSAGFTTQSSLGNLRSGEIFTVPQIGLALATAVTEVRVVPARIDVAEDEIKVEEKQRVLGVVPNFYVSYDQNAVPLAPKQKFELAWKTIVDPVSFGLTAAVAGIQQAQNEFSGYGQGAQAYGKYYAASYGNFVAGTFIGSAVLPSLLKQDPRYFYKGTGSKRSRILYAMANSVICKGDNGHWQANYSSIVGSLAAGGISNLYYPAKNREGAELTFENALIGIGESAAINLLQEFVMRKLTPSVSKHEPAKAPNAISKVWATFIHDGD